MRPATILACLSLIAGGVFGDRAKGEDTRPFHPQLNANSFRSHGEAADQVLAQFASPSATSYSLKQPETLAVIGAPGETRTHNPRLRRPVLYPVELRAPSTRRLGRLPSGAACCYVKNWSGRWDSNSRPSAPKADALPGCATPREARILQSSLGGVNRAARFY